MIFFDFPIEICVLIINYLDVTSKINLYNASKSLRKLFAPCHVKRLVLSRSRMATAKTLGEEFCLSLGSYIQDLNLSGLQDLTVTTLKLSILKMHNLQTLDVTFTNIFLSGLFIEMCTDLYSLFIESDMPAEQLTLLMAPLRVTAQKLHRSHLRIEVCDCYRGWNPFVDVFNPSPLHILD